MEKLRNLFARKDRQYGMVVVLVLIILLFQALTGGVLLKPLNVTNVILQNSYIMVLAIGMLLTILTGNIDLSVGSIAAFVGAVSGVLAIGNKMDPILAIVVSLVIGAVIGAWNGFWIAYVRIPAFIVTLGSQMIFRGLTMVILQGQTLSPFPSSYQIIGSGFVPDLFSGTLNMVAVFAGVFCMVVYSVSEILKRRKQKAYEIEVENRYSFYLKLLLVNAAFILFTYWMAAYQGIPTVLVYWQRLSCCTALSQAIRSSADISTPSVEMKRLPGCPASGRRRCFSGFTLIWAFCLPWQELCMPAV